MRPVPTSSMQRRSNMIAFNRNRYDLRFHSTQVQVCVSQPHHRLSQRARKFSLSFLNSTINLGEKETTLFFYGTFNIHAKVFGGFMDHYFTWMRYIMLIGTSGSVQLRTPGQYCFRPKLLRILLRENKQYHRYGTWINLDDAPYFTST
jgi:hypothetical protein